MIFVCCASFNWDWILIKNKHLLRLHFFSTKKVCEQTRLEKSAKPCSLSAHVLFFLPEHGATPSRSLSGRRLPRSVSQSLESFAVAHLRSLDAKHTNTHPRRRNPRQHRGSLSVAAGWQLEHKHSQLDSVSAGGGCLALLGDGRDGGGASQFILVSPHSQS